MAAPLLLLTVVGLFAAITLAIIASLTKSYALLKFVGGAAGFWLLAYVSLMLFLSLTSKERVLAINEPKEFCGFYLDCHLHLAVTGIQQSRTLSGPSGTQTANGTFCIVAVKVYSDAKRASIGLLDPRAVVTDQRGRSFVPVDVPPEVFNVPNAALNQMVGPGESFTKQLVFDLPQDVVEPKLQVNEGYAIDRWLELFLIGDEDSLLHQKVKFRLDGN